MPVGSPHAVSTALATAWASWGQANPSFLPWISSAIALRPPPTMRTGFPVASADAYFDGTINPAASSRNVTRWMSAAFSSAFSRFRRLVGQQLHVVRDQGRGAHLGAPRPVADEEEQHSRLPDGHGLRGFEHGVEPVREAVVSCVEHDVPIPETVLAPEALAGGGIGSDRSHRPPSSGSPRLAALLAPRAPPPSPRRARRRRPPFGGFLERSGTASARVPTAPAARRGRRPRPGTGPRPCRRTGRHATGGPRQGSRPAAGWIGTRRRRGDVARARGRPRETGRSRSPGHARPNSPCPASWRERGGRGPLATPRGGAAALGPRRSAQNSQWRSRSCRTRPSPLRDRREAAPSARCPARSTG